MPCKAVNITSDFDLATKACIKEIRSSVVAKAWHK